MSTVPGRKAFPSINSLGNHTAMAISQSTCGKGPASASAVEMLDAFSFAESCGSFCLCPQQLDAQIQVRVSPCLASPSWGAPWWHRLGGGSLPSSPFGILFNSTSASCILASWHAACFYFSWICLDDEAC